MHDLETTRPTVFVIDDDASIRNALHLLIKSVGLTVETHASGRQFLNDFDPTTPGCLVLDLRMPGMSGLELQEELHRRGISIPVIFITGHGDVPAAVRAMKAGAADFVEKPFSDQFLLDTIQRAIAQDTQMRKRWADAERARDRLETLTPREREVANLVVAGKASKQIAAELRISQKTVEVHRLHIMEKLGVGCVVDLVRMVFAARMCPAGTGHRREMTFSPVSGAWPQETAAELACFP